MSDHDASLDTTASSQTTASPAHLDRNLVRLCVFHGMTRCVFPVAVFSLFLRDDIGLDVGTILVTQAGFSVAVALLEFPSGYLADRWGYSKTLRIGALFALVGWAVYTSVTSLATVLLGEAILGIGFALISGADIALLTESLGRLGRQRETARWLGRHQFAGQVAEASSALVAGGLYAVWHRLPFALDVLVFAGAALLVTRLVEVSVPDRAVFDHRSKIRELVTTATWGNPPLRRVIVTLVLFMLASYVPVWLIPLYAVDTGLPVVWIGPLWAFSSGLVAVSALLSERLRARWGLGSILGTCVALLALGYFGLALSHSVLGIAFYLCLPLLRGLSNPLLMSEEQLFIACGDRASVVSLRSFSFRLAFVITGPVVGFSVDRFGQRPVLFVSGAVLTIALSFSVWAVSKSKTPAAEPA